MEPKSVICSSCSLEIRIEKSVPSSAEACFSTAEGLIESNSFERAIGLTCIGLAREPDSCYGRFVRAFALDKAGKNDLAVRDWTACIEGNYRPWGSRLKRAQAYRMRKEFTNALSDYEMLLQADLSSEHQLQTKVAQFNMERAQTLCELAEFEKAIHVYTMLLDGELSAVRERERITKYAVHDARGVAFCRAGLFDEARQDLNLVLPYSSSGGMVSYWLLVCKYRGDESKAMAEWSKM